MPSEKVRLRIGNLAKAVLISGQAYQDPKDALNEFVSNAADEYAQMGIKGERIRIYLHRRGRYPLLAIEDSGRGLDAEGLRRVARNLFQSSKSGDSRTIGEKAIGLLAFQQLGGRLEIVTKAKDADKTLGLKLERGKATASLELNERRRARTTSGTTVYISDLDPDVLRVLTQRKVVEYLRARRGSALAAGHYTIEVIESRRSEIVTPERPEGIRLNIPAHPTLWGRIEFAVYVSPVADKRRRVAVVGTGGTTIVDDIAEIEEFSCPPWSTDQVSGQIVFEALKQTAGRRALLRDRDAFPVFADAVKSIEPAVARTLEGVAREVDMHLAGRLAEAVRRLFARVLKELADIENPMRTPVGTEQGEGSLFVETPEHDDAGDAEPGVGASLGQQGDPPDLGDLLPPDGKDESPVPETRQAWPSGSRSKALPSIAVDPNPDGQRSRFDSDSGVVYYNDRHPDYLLVKHDEGALFDYLSTLVAKEYVVFNNPESQSDEIGEEMVRMLVRIRRFLPRKNPASSPRGRG